jgi:4-hydroxy-tetrahydrodipicolinate synthase
MDKVSLPVMLYNVPGRASMTLSYEAVRKIKDHPNYWSIKEASGSAEIMKEYLCASAGKPVYCGDDGLLPSFINAGASGLISVAGNTWPIETNLYVQKCLDKTIGAAAPIWQAAANSLFIASNPIPAKAILASEGRIAHGETMPPLSTRDLKDLSKLALSSNNIRTWYKNNQ